MKLKRVILLTVAFAVLGISAYAQGGSSPSDEAPKKAAAFRPTKDQIRQGQEILIKAKLWNGEATGVYGECRPAIKEYQKANGLDVNGKFDRATLEKMGIALTDSQKGMAAGSAASSEKTADKTSSASTATTDGPKRPAPFRANKGQIEAAQKILRDGKMLTGGEDGKLDDDTREGLGKYQDANGLKVTKTLNATTLEKMKIALTDKQKEQVAAQAAYDAAKAKN